ncbi:MAG: hypothetical protein M3P18_21630 [Actinomycetota bacterium]|nr:hypothetical protein [Actinomycetota bacterium]
MSGSEVRTADSGYVALPFTARWTKELDRAMRQGAGWYVLSAGSQHGKTTANRRFWLDHPSERTNTSTSVPVAVAWTSSKQKLVLRSLAESLGGKRFAQMSGREMRVADAIHRFGTKLVIVNNSHMLEWKQFEELLSLDDVCSGNYGRRPAIVLSGVYDSELRIGNLPKRWELTEQILKRIARLKTIPGHDREEVRSAISLLLRRDCPTLLAEGAAKHHGLVFELLTGPEVNLSGGGLVAGGDLVELVRCIVAFRGRAPGPDTDIADLIRKAFAYFVRERGGSNGTKTSPVIERLSRSLRARDTDAGAA